MTGQATAGRFAGQAALVTGGSTGIGFAAARALGLGGAAVMIAARRVDVGQQSVRVLRDQGVTAEFVATDITDPASTEAMVKACVSTFGGLNFAFNNAGIVGHVHTAVADADIEMFDQVIATNVRGTWLSMKYEVPAMLAAGGGSIVNCSSGAGLRGGPRSSAYYASKHAIIGMTRSVALEYADKGIRVNAVCPGLTLTETVSETFADAPEKFANFSARIPMGRPGNPGEIGAAVAWLAGPESSFITGVALPVDGGTTT